MKTKYSTDPRFSNPTSATQLLAKQLMESGNGKVNNIGEGINSALGSLAGAWLQNKSDTDSAQKQKDYYNTLNSLQMLNKESGGSNEDLVAAMAGSSNPFVSQDSQAIKNQLLAEQLKPQKPSEVAAGGALIDPKTGKVIYTNPNQPGGAGGGQIGYIYDKIKKEHPDWSDTQIIYAAQTGMRQGLGMDVNGGVAPINGVPQAKGAIKYGEQGGTNQSNLEYAAPIETAKKTAELAAEQQGNINKKAYQAGNAIDLIGQAETILPAASNGLVSAGSNRAMNVFGVSTTQSQADRQLKVLSAGLTANVPRMEGPQSDKDVQMYKEAAADIGNSNVPYKDRLAALKVMKGIQQKYQNTGGVTSTENISTGGSISTPQGWTIKERK